VGGCGAQSIVCSAWAKHGKSEYVVNNKRRIVLKRGDFVNNKRRIVLKIGDLACGWWAGG
jgi:hypothetical protein